MKSHSSTSNSEESFAVGKLPWALFIAIGLLVLVEVWVQRQNPNSIIPYENTGRASYSAVRNYLNAEGSAAVGFLGSSRGREAIVVPDIRKDIKETVGKRYSVANYSSPAATGDEIEKLVRLILRQDKKPKILLYGVSPLQLSKSALSTTHKEELWYFDDWWREKKKTRRNIFGVIPDYQYDILPDVIRNEIGSKYLTFGYRDKASMLMHELFSGSKSISCPIAGDYSDKQSRKRRANLSLEDRPISQKRVKAYLSKRMVNGEYPLSQRQVEHIRSAIRMCKEENIVFVIYELPLAQILVDNMPPETRPEFLAMIDKLAEEEDVPFVKVKDLEISFTDADFREQSHMNRPGATVLSKALTEQIIIPQLSSEMTP